jgi:DNA-binding response OmpR family regulator
MVHDIEPNGPWPASRAWRLVRFGAGDHGPPGASPTHWGASSDGVTAKARPRVLIVEDEALIALDLELRLTRLGYDVCGVADHCAEALSLFRDEGADLVLMDISIRGDVDGIDTALALRTMADVPVIFLSAYTDGETRARALVASPYGHIGKPFDEAKLEEVMRHALTRHADELRDRAAKTRE